MKKVSLKVGQKELSGHFLKVGKTLWAHINGEVITYEPESVRSAQKQEVSLDPTRIKAPMPGKITKVNKTSGDAVTSGDICVVMEAMKMEYALKIQMDGVVEAVNVSEGDQVSQGQELVKVKENG